MELYIIRLNVIFILGFNLSYCFFLKFLLLFTLMNKYLMFCKFISKERFILGFNPM